MNVSELISSWTEDERRQHSDLIAECLKREQLLNGLKGQMRASEEELRNGLDHLISKLNNLALTVNVNADQIRNIYLRLAKVQGNA